MNLLRFISFPCKQYWKCQKIIYSSIIYKEILFSSDNIFDVWFIERGGGNGTEDRDRFWCYLSGCKNACIYFKFLTFPILNLTNAIKAEVVTQVIHLVQMEKN